MQNFTQINFKLEENSFTASGNKLPQSLVKEGKSSQSPKLVKDSSTNGNHRPILMESISSKIVINQIQWFVYTVAHKQPGFIQECQEGVPYSEI